MDIEIEKICPFRTYSGASSSSSKEGIDVCALLRVTTILETLPASSTASSRESPRAKATAKPAT